MDGKFDDPLMRLLFGSDSRQLRNLKLLRGDARDVNEQDLRDEVHGALLQVQMGDAPACNPFPEAESAHNVTIDKLNELC